MSQQVKDRSPEVLKVAASWPDADRVTLVTSCFADTACGGYKRLLSPEAPLLLPNRPRAPEAGVIQGSKTQPAWGIRQPSASGQAGVRYAEARAGVPPIAAQNGEAGASRPLSS